VIINKKKLVQYTNTEKMATMFEPYLNRAKTARPQIALRP
jgi:hypothetical protein